MFDYESLRLFTWAIVGVLLIGFTLTDGFDMGVAALLPIMGKNNLERRVMLNAIAPHWDGNQVWLLTAGGAIFAIWPLVYAVAFSGFYIAMMLVLASLWLRPIGMDYRAKIDNPQWRSACDIALFISGVIPPIIFGVGFGNLLVGVPFELNNLLMLDYQGGFFDLLTPFPILCGLVSLSMVVTQGAAFLQMKTKHELRTRAQNITLCGAGATMMLFMFGGLFAASQSGYIIIGTMPKDSISNPLNKQVVSIAGGLLHNFIEMPQLWLIPFTAVTSLLVCIWATVSRRAGVAFTMSSITITCIILTVGATLFPMIIPSSINPSHSLTLWDATSSEKTLSIISIVAIIVVPVILGYTAWCYYKMFGRLDNNYIRSNSSSLY
ncbi:cytochrome d ubiquinol oxidase subunit II [Vibrio parahaemolyticus]|uniref:cytochrome d ubiquinol oxidase subunit II n=1 Tax=Vibrio parahaemolyticus TaxID=670 RepID=UPI00084BA9C6|nr:cytochrome d ubiquinol oxidase subunit II [Vibrio parahaemolyticus]EGQ8084433.1 cytochrome d ubiquinol oxidase subunit II [Vibrio parahaemolyticus]EID0733635.1 cytochrome d ubiquinol oxidase subunit II [Vibrio parahaemolyticus]ELA9417208.1 cytochrome d ubiquinol oxidase subunit II [Vibrio parahaemolyticus]ODY08378.1 cytochrome d ubiquinol oxidase subunit II [Vibrio parahaemolyticus]